MTPRQHLLEADNVVIDVGLGGGGDTDPRTKRIADLEQENRNLRRQRDDAQIEAARAREDATRALLKLRTTLSPLYRALQAVFGEIEAAGVGDEPPVAPAAATSNGGAPPTVGAREAAIWESWKKRLGPGCAEVINALLLQPDLNTTQLAIAIGKNRKAVPSLVWKLNQAGLINKNNNRFSLKQV